MTLNEAPIIAFLATADAARAREFYEGQIGLTLVEDSDFALVFEVNGVEVRIQKVGDVDPKPFTVLGWEVPSIPTTVRELSNKGVVFKQFDELEQSDMGVWKSPSGAKVAWFEDPDGNMLSITEK